MQQAADDALALVRSVWDSGFTWGVLSSALVFLTCQQRQRQQGWPAAAAAAATAEGTKDTPVQLTVHMGQAEGAAHDEHAHAPFTCERLSEAEMLRRSAGMLRVMKTRRSVRFFSKDAVPFEVVANCVTTAGTSPSGAHCQPWRFLVVGDPGHKAAIRRLVEEQERANYTQRMKKDWVDAVEPMVNKIHATGIEKPYLTDAPYIIVLMKEAYALGEDGSRVEHYYPEQSVGIAAGLLLTALHTAGLVTLTSTPLGAERGIRELLQRPKNEKVYLLLPVGHPAMDATVPFRPPGAEHKPLDQLLVPFL